MLRMTVARLEPGMVLARPIPMPNEPGRKLLERGCEIPPDLAQRLERFGIREVWVAHPSFEFLEELVDERQLELQRDLYWAVRRCFESIQRGTTTIDERKLEAAIGAVYDGLVLHKSGMLVEKLDACADYLPAHSANVCYLALLLSLKLERYLIDERNAKASRAREVRELGLGCLLHDIGKLKLPAAVLNKPSELTIEERELVKQHTTLGYDLVKGRIPTASAQVVLNHHQRFDGAGYPERVDPKSQEKLPALAGKQIPVLCRVASICDMYDAATTARCYAQAKPAAQALREMRTEFHGAHDPVIEAAFLQIVPPFPIGSCVTLSDGSEAAVCNFNPLRPYAPKVRRLKNPDGFAVERPDLDEIELATCDVSITHVGDAAVHPWIPVGSDRAAEPLLI